MEEKLGQKKKGNSFYVFPNELFPSGLVTFGIQQLTVPSSLLQSLHRFVRGLLCSRGALCINPARGNHASWDSAPFILVHGTAIRPLVSCECRQSASECSCRLPHSELSASYPVTVKANPAKPGPAQHKAGPRSSLAWAWTFQRVWGDPHVALTFSLSVSYSCFSPGHCGKVTLQSWGEAVVFCDPTWSTPAPNGAWVNSGGFCTRFCLQL